MKKQRLSKSQSNKIKHAIFQHERHKNSYFWDTPLQASHRRTTERENSYVVKFRLAGNDYEYSSSVTCSAKNYYYDGSFFLNDERRNVRLFKNLL